LDNTNIVNEIKEAVLLKNVQTFVRFGFVVFFSLMGVGFHSIKAQSLTAVDLELVLAVDCSGSVDNREFDLQMVGLAKAFVHRDVIRALGVAGNRGVAVSLVQWSGYQTQSRSVNWFVVRDAASALQFAKMILESKRFVRGSTSTAGAIQFSTNEILTNAYQGRRKIIDVSGDGKSNPELSFAQSMLSQKQGITINGLVIFSKEYDLGVLDDFDLAQFYAENVIGGEGAFLMEAKGYDDFARAIRKKLVREISGNAVARR